jgi:hypothetical protein
LSANGPDFLGQPCAAAKHKSLFYRRTKDTYDPQTAW